MKNPILAPRNIPKIKPVQNISEPPIPARDTLDLFTSYDGHNGVLC